MTGRKTARPTQPGGGTSAASGTSSSSACRTTYRNSLSRPPVTAFFASPPPSKLAFLQRSVRASTRRQRRSSVSSASASVREMALANRTTSGQGTDRPRCIGGGPPAAFAPASASRIAARPRASSRWSASGRPASAAADGQAKAQAEPPVIAGRHEHEGVDAAGEGLGGRAELGVDAAAVVRPQEDARAVRPVGQPPRAAFEGVAFRHEEGHALVIGVRAPALRFDPAPLLVADADVVRPAARRAAAAVPVLKDGQRPHRHGHRTTAPLRLSG